MATPLDGPGPSASDYTWGSKFGWVQYSDANATTEEGTLLFTGGGNYYFDFNGGVDNTPFFSLPYSIGLNDTYFDELVGKNITPAGQSLPIVPDGPRPGPVTAMTADLFTSPDFVQYITDLPGPEYYYYGVEAVEGFTNQGP